MGARPMARVIQDNLKKPLANELLFGSLVDGGGDGGTGSGEERTDVRFPECGEAQAGSGSLISYVGLKPGISPVLCCFSASRWEAGEGHHAAEKFCEALSSFVRCWFWINPQP